MTIKDYRGNWWHMARTSISLAHGRILVRGAFEKKDALKATPTAKWEPEAKAWTFADSPTTRRSLRSILGEVVPVEDVPAASTVELRTIDPQPWPHQREAAQRIGQDYAFYLHGGMGVGKAIPVDSDVMTPSGVRRAGDITEGDDLIDPITGHATEVIEVFPQGSLDVFRVTFCDGTSARCSADHLWAVQSAKHKHRGHGFSVRPLKELHPVEMENGNRRHFIPMTAPVQFTSVRDLPLDPYLLGLLLGDGGFTHGVPVFSKPEPDLVISVRDALPFGMKMTELKSGSWSLPDPTCSGNRLTEELRALGLWGLCSTEKFIPECYLLASPDDRLQLLRGLIDTDGDVSPSGRVTTYNTSSPRLRDGAIFLIQSLGGNAPWSSRDPKYVYNGEKRTGKKAYRVHVSLPAHLCPVSSEKHLARWKPPKKYPPRRAIVSIEPDGAAECVCFKVASPSGLFLLNDFIVTHNTRTAVDAVVSFGFARTLILCPSSVVRVWPGEFKKYAADPVELVALDASAGSIAKRVKAAEMASKRAAALRRPLVIVINYEAAWREPFAGWASGQEWDLVVLDECQRLKSAQGRASKWVEGLRSLARHMVGLSGTPMPHGPLDVFAQFRALDPGIFGSSLTRFKLRYEAQAFVIRPDANPDRRVLLALEQMDGLHGPWQAASTWGTDFSVAFQIARLGLSNQDIVDALAYRAVSRGEEPRGYNWFIPLLNKVREKLGNGGSAVQRWQHLDELRAKMDTITMHVGREVLSLTEATETVRHVTLSPAERKAHDELAEDLATELDAGRVTAANALTKLLRLQQATGGFLKLDEEDGGGIVQLGNSRAAVLAEVFEELREDRLDGEVRHEPVVVFCRFHADMDSVHQAALEVTGQDALELSGRVNQLAEWQQDGAPPVLAVQIQAGGLGVSMVRACFAVYYSVGYSLADLEQAKARVHRPGQARPVTHIFMVADDTVDEHVYAAIKSKAEVVEHVLGALKGKQTKEQGAEINGNQD